MLKKSLVALGAMTAFSSVAMANYQGPTNSVSKVTVNQLSSMPEDTRVILEGRLTNQLGAEYFEFTDKTGVITVEIDREDLPYDFEKNQPMSFSEKDTVLLRGEVDHEDNRQSSIDVEEMKVM